MKVVVLGGGPAGLAAGWELAESGVPVEVIEKNSVVGGMSSSFTHGGCVLDYGTHGFHRSSVENQAIVDRMVELMGSDFFSFSRKASVHFQGKYFSFPLQPKDIFFGLNAWLALKCFFDFLATRVSRRLGAHSTERNFDDWVKNRFGRRLYDIYFGPYTQKVWGIPPSRLTLSWAEDRIPSPSLWSVAKKAIFKTRQDKSDEHAHSPYRAQGLTTERGAIGMWEKVAERIEALGGSVKLNTEARRIISDRKIVRSASVSSGGGDSRVYCDWLISTIPVTMMVEMLHPSPETDLLNRTRALKYRAMLLLFLIVRKEQVTPYQWIYYSSRDLLFNRISEFGNISRVLVPPGKSSLCLEITCFEGDDVWNAGEEEIFARCISGLERLGLLRERQVEAYLLRRLPHAYPVADLDYESNFPHIEAHLKAYPNLLSVGRQGRFAYLNMDEAMGEGFRAAREVLAAASGMSAEPNAVNHAAGGG